MRSQIYFPILRAKAGEYGGLARLSEYTKSLVCPTVDLPKAQTPQVFEILQAAVVRSLAETWGTANPLFLDLSRYEPDEQTSDGTPYVTRLFDSARQLGLRAAPVVGPVLERFGANGAYFRGVAQAVARDGRGVAIRLPPDVIAEVEKLGGTVDQIEQLLSVQDNSCDLFLDFGPLDKLPVSRSKVTDFLQDVCRPALGMLEKRRFRSMVFCASSIPRSLGKNADGEAVRIQNAEFKTWSSLVEAPAGRGIRFGDYAARYALQSDKAAKVSAPARINIVTPDAHLLSVGDGSSYRDLANKVSAAPEFTDQCGVWGKHAVRDAGRGHGGVGGAADWVARDTHMHLETVTNAAKKRLNEIGEVVSPAAVDAFVYEQVDLGF